MVMLENNYKKYSLKVGKYMDFQHFLITRFNIVMPWKEYFRPDNEWCQRRAALFEEFCLPSVSNQSQTKFEWLVLFDQDSTPAFLKDRMNQYRHVVPSFRPVYMGIFTPESLQKIISKRVDRNTDRIVTTRIDTDDVIASRYMECVQNILVKDEKFLGFINFDLGYFFEGNKSYTYCSGHNAFFSLVEQNAFGFQTCHHFNHNKIEQHGPVKHIKEGRWYVFTNHDNNISHRTSEKDRRRRVPNQRLYEKFEVPAFRKEESYIDITIENTFLFAKRLYGLLQRTVKRSMKFVLNCLSDVIAG